MRLLFFLLALIVLTTAPAEAQTLTVSNATLRLDDHGILDLGTTTTLAETNGGRIAGGTGVIRAMRTLDAPSAENVAGLGAVLTSAEDLGLTTITRGHTVQSLGATGIRRYYDIAPTTNSGLDATLTFTYDENELNGLTESDLFLHRSDDDGVTWTRIEGPRDAAANTLTVSGLDSFSRWTAADVITLLADLRLFLQGSYNASFDEMTADLNSGGHLPLNQPYGGAPWTCTGDCDASVASAFFESNASVVDWVYLQLRSGDPASPPMTVEAETVGFVMQDGSVVAVDGTSPVGFSDPATASSYHVVAFHRNHLAVMSTGAVDFSSGTASYDFTTAPSQAYGSNALVGLESGVWGLWCADGDLDGQITAPDFNLYLQAASAGAVGYLSADFDLNGQVATPDYDLYLEATSAGATSKVPEGQQ